MNIDTIMSPPSAAERKPLMKEKTWTVRQMQAEGACYDVATLRRLWAGRKALTLAQILELEIPATDRLWVCWRPGALTEAQCAAVQDVIVTRAVRTYALPEPSTAEWAQRWLEGTDRTAARAVWAAWAAEAAAAEAGAAEYERQIADMRAVQGMIDVN